MWGLTSQSCRSLWEAPSDGLRTDYWLREVLNLQGHTMLHRCFCISSLLKCGHHRQVLTSWPRVQQLNDVSTQPSGQVHLKGWPQLLSKCRIKNSMAKLAMECTETYEGINWAPTSVLVCGRCGKLSETLTQGNHQRLSARPFECYSQKKNLTLLITLNHCLR